MRAVSWIFSLAPLTKRYSISAIWFSNAIMISKGNSTETKQSLSFHSDTHRKTHSCGRIGALLWLYRSAPTPWSLSILWCLEEKSETVATSAATLLTLVGDLEIFTQQPFHDTFYVIFQRVSYASIHVILGDVLVRQPSALQHIQDLPHVPVSQGQQGLFTIFGHLNPWKIKLQLETTNMKDYFSSSIT